MQNSFGSTDAIGPISKRPLLRQLQCRVHGALQRIGSILGYGSSKIEVKVSFGYLPLVVAVILISINAMANLRAVNDLNRSIVENDMVLLDAANKMADQILAQESYGRRYLLLKSPEMLDLFHRYDRAFKSEIVRICALPAPRYVPVDSIRKIHGQFNHLYRSGIDSGGFTQEIDLQIQKKLAEMMALIGHMESTAKTEQQLKMLESSRIGKQTLQTTAVLLGLGILFGIGSMFCIIRGMVRRVQQLKLATREISQGRFDHVMAVTARDELGELAEEFDKMAGRLAQLEEASLDTSPLTRLPGGLAIENVLRTRLGGREQVAFCLMDIDNFKAFNDRYGYVRGNAVIRTLAKIILDAVAGSGSPGDFVGHIGGDDFALITRPEAFPRLCQEIIDRFDRTIPDLYDDADKQRGYILGKSRQGADTRFPIMSVSIGVVANDLRSDMNPIQVGEIAAELKAHAKSLPGSVIIRDRRGTEE